LISAPTRIRRRKKKQKDIYSRTAVETTKWPNDAGLDHKIFRQNWTRTGVYKTRWQTDATAGDHNARRITLINTDTETDCLRI
jgi:hypothetical protein